MSDLVSDQESAVISSLITRLKTNKTFNELIKELES